MQLKIEQNCPSCGASIVLDEDDRLIQCEFCDVHNYKVSSVASRYVLPVNLPEHIVPEQLFYAPYLRFKGSIFYVRDKEVKYKIVDTSRLGLQSSKLPVSLGLRPQAMKIQPVVSSTSGSFINQSIATKTVFAHAAKIIDLFSERGDHVTYHRAFIGETLSRIYQPCYLEDDLLYDAVNNRVIGSQAGLDKCLTQTCSSKVSWEPQFITTICPGCGGLLDGARDSMVLQCTNCESQWQELGGRFTPVEWTVVNSEDRRARYLPFWQIKISSQDHGLNSFGDYLRFTNQPQVPREKHDSLPLVFWVPAFKINPKAFLQAASQLTAAQMRIPEGEVRRVNNGFPVTLDKKEAIQAIKTVLANTTVNKEKRFNLLSEMRLVEAHTVLTYLPFVAHTHDLVQEHTLTNIQTAALRYGRAL